MLTDFWFAAEDRILLDVVGDGCLRRERLVAVDRYVGNDIKLLSAMEGVQERKCTRIVAVRRMVTPQQAAVCLCNTTWGNGWGRISGMVALEARL